MSEDLDFVQFGGGLDRDRIARVLAGIRGPEKPELITSLVARQTIDTADT